MMRTQIQLPEPEYDRLRELAARLRRSMADCIREGIRLFLDRAGSKADDLSDIAGRFRPLSVKDLKPHDRGFIEAAISSKKTRRKA
jgi:Arc/MetJ-type ribon-helix-helix transcriptional regulator